MENGVFMTRKNQLLGMAAAFVANTIFGFSFIFSKLALQVAHPLIILAIRFTVAFAVLNVILAVFKIKLNLKGKPKTKLIFMGLAQPLLYFIFELYGLSLVSSAVSGIIIALVPVGVILLATIFLKEKPTVLQVLCTLLCVVGVSAMSVLSNDGSKNHFVGILLLTLAVICASVFNILSRGESANFTPIERTYVMFLLATVGFAVISVLTLRESFIGQFVAAVSAPVFWVAIAYLAVLSSVAAFLLYNYSTTVISVVQSSSFANIIPVVTVLAGVVFLKERFTLWQYLLCLLIISGVWGVNLFANKKTPKV